MLLNVWSHCLHLKLPLKLCNSLTSLQLSAQLFPRFSRTQHQTIFPECGVSQILFLFCFYFCGNEAYKKFILFSQEVVVAIILMTKIILTCHRDQMWMAGRTKQKIYKRHKPLQFEVIWQAFIRLGPDLSPIPVVLVTEAV